MKSLTSICVLFIVTVLSNSLVSCSKNIQTKPDPVIFIKGSNYTTGELTLDPPASDTIKVNRSNWVVWIILPNSGVKSIDSIPPKVGSKDVFKQGNPYQDNSYSHSLPVWRGKIEPSLKVPAIEDYRIFWKDTLGVQHVFDPTIKVDPDTREE